MRWLYLLVFVSAGCNFDPNTRIVSESESDAPDAGTPGVGVTLDSGSSPGGAADAADNPNSPAVDAAPLLSCQDVYGQALNYDLCEETATSCRFYVVTSEDTCTNLCSSFGGACIDNYDGNCGTNVGSEGCNVVHNDQVCICTLPTL